MAWPTPSAGGAPRLASALALALAACDGGGEPYFGATDRRGKDPSTFYTNNFGEPSTLDPGVATDGSSAPLILQMFEGLTTYDPRDGHPVQGVAVRWEKSDDNRVFRFHLRPEARWSDGAPVTAGDFEYAWKRALRPSTASGAAPTLYLLKNGELFNRRKLRVARSGVPLRSGPRAEAAQVGALPRGAAVVVRGPSERGYVPVARHRDLPTYSAERGGGARAGGAPEVVGYAPEGELVEDDAVVGVRAAGDLTLEVELERASPYFLDLTGNHNLAPVRRDVVERFERSGEPDLWTRPESIVVNGPYTLDSWTFQYEITMRQNPYYWDAGALRIRRLVWTEVDSQHATMNLYKAGDLDFLGDNITLPAEYSGLLSQKRDHVQFPYLGTLWYELNTRRPPLDDVRVRRALHLAVDRRELVATVLRGGAIAATHYVPEYAGGGYAEQAARDREAGVDPFSAPGASFDPERARALLVEAGYPVVREGDRLRARGFPPLEILYNVAEEHRKVAVAIQDMWKRHLGVSVTLRAEEWKVMLKTIRDGHFQIARLGWVAEYNHPHTWLSSFLSQNPQNPTGFTDPELDALVEAAARTGDPAEGIRRYREAERRALDAMVRIPLYFRSRDTLVKPWVKGFYPTPRDIHLARWLWIDPAWQDDPGNDLATAPRELPPPGRIEDLAGEVAP